jgi:hypothetical protein
VEIPERHYLTLSAEQLLLLDWQIAYRGGARVKARRVVPGPAVEFDIYFPSNSPDNRSLDVVSSGEGGKGAFAGTDIQGYETYALRFTLVSINGGSAADMQQKVAAGAVLGPTEAGELSSYEPVVLGFAGSANAAVAKTPVSTDRIYQIGFHVHMQNPQVWDPNGSIMRLRVEPVNEDAERDEVGAAASDVAGSAGYPGPGPDSTVSVSGAPVITSAPVTRAIAGLPYSYDVDAIDPDEGDILRYSLVSSPSNMSINPTTGLIRWEPTTDHAGTNEEVVVRVSDNRSVPGAASQSFTIAVITPPSKKKRLEVLNGYNQRRRRTLLIEGTLGLVQSSDDERLEIDIGSYVSFEFFDVTIPDNAEIESVVVFVEHFEQERFEDGKLEWCIGTGWPARPAVWASIKAPVHTGESNEAVDSWDITSLADTHERINSVQLKVENNCHVVDSRSLIDCAYLVVTLD